MFDQMLPSLITLSLLLCMLLWALLIDFCIHLQKRGSPHTKDSRVERRKSQSAEAPSRARFGSSPLIDR